MSKFTQGPWSFQAPGDFNSDYVRCDKKLAGAPVGMGIIRILKSRVPREEADANGYLVAAAPDLFNACKAVMLRDDIADCELGEQIAAALAKAQGGALFPAKQIL